MRNALALTLMLASSPAFAGWEVGNFIDQMTDRKETFATLSATESTARLYVGCKNGEVFPEIDFPRRIGYGDVGTVHRFDAGELVTRTTPLSRDGKSLWIWIGAPDPAPAALASIRRSKRLRVQVRNEVLDFDLTGADAALRGIKCR